MKVAFSQPPSAVPYAKSGKLRALATTHTKRVSQLPEVFDVKARPWINIEGAATERIIEQVNRCPTGALTYLKKA